MDDEPRPELNRRLWATIIAVAIVAAFVLNTWGGQFFVSLRLADALPANASAPSFSGSNPNRLLPGMIGEMLSKKVNATLDEQVRPVPNADSAGKLAAFTAQLPRARTDAPVLSVLGARTITLTIDRAQLRTILVQAGKPATKLPDSWNGATVVIRSPRAIRAQYGNCPVPPPATLQSQIQGTPPPSTDNGNCVVLTETPAASADLPAGFNLVPLVAIALELSGMSPNQTLAFQQTFDWKSTLVLSLPRQMRSYDAKNVNGAPGMLINTAGRRGPTYALIWTKNGIVYSLAGYGSSADAMPLALSLH